LARISSVNWAENRWAFPSIVTVDVWYAPTATISSGALMRAM